MADDGLKVVPQGKVNLKYGDEVIEGVEIGLFTKTFKGKKSTFYSTKAIPELNIDGQYIRLYLSDKIGMSFDELVKPLFEGESVYVEKIPYANKQGTYSATLSFDPKTVPSYVTGKATFSGDLIRDFNKPE